MVVLEDFDALLQRCGLLQAHDGAILCIGFCFLGRVAGVCTHGSAGDRAGCIFKNTLHRINHRQFHPIKEISDWPPPTRNSGVSAMRQATCAKHKPPVVSQAPLELEQVKDDWPERAVVCANAHRARHILPRPRVVVVILDRRRHGSRHEMLAAVTIVRERNLWGGVRLRLHGMRARTFCRLNRFRHLKNSQSSAQLFLASHLASLLGIVGKCGPSLNSVPRLMAIPSPRANKLGALW